MSNRNTFTNLTEAEKRGMFLQMDKYDYDNGLPWVDCRVYGIAWVQSDGEIMAIKTPDVGYVEMPFGRYMRKVIQQTLASHKIDLAEEEVNKQDN